ncbi:hypothetical protein EV643_114230 [Kribbella sp. VKM Ac-2527]|uniref:Uncharacterized protein n=1 Tax=Kribbella caucasensis TaxID=2512215 RepID=A0A4R6K6U2_9ACTN|nr:hypothetical protein [Kribbella sp. VKM Ac-2527]TDO45085.1 hypothetical protein EV643_114230 [Kribbella sp. VKM Ac-2527]
MKTQDRPLDQDDLAMADLGEIGDWTPIAGPDDDESGPAVVRALVGRVMNSTDWQPWPLQQGEVIGPEMVSWGFTTRRGTTMVVFPGLAFPDVTESGWSAYELGPDDIAAAEAGLDAHWPDHLALAITHWGQPDYVGDDSSPTFADDWAQGAGAGRRHLAVWLRPGAQYHLYSTKPSKDPLSTAVGVNYAVYLD